jgi:hypothetical protein
MSAHCKRTEYRIVGEENKRRISAGQKRKYRKIINRRELGQHCTLSGSTPQKLCLLLLFK